MSFLTGSYITLTNLSEREMERICALKISPINVSVHATDPEMRAKLMGNPKAADIMGPLRRLTAAGITVDCQIVCCPGYNDKEQLSRSMRELAELYPGVNSVSIVPVGLTMHRERLAKLTPFDKESASETIDRVEAFAEKCLAGRGSRIFWCSDELYLKAGQGSAARTNTTRSTASLKTASACMRLLRDGVHGRARVDRARRGHGLPSSPSPPASRPRRCWINFYRQAHKKCAKIKGRVVRHRQRLFRPHDRRRGPRHGRRPHKRSSRAASSGERVLIPHTMLRHGEGVFLDDVTLEQASAELGVPVTPVGGSGDELLAAMLGTEI